MPKSKMNFYLKLALFTLLSCSHQNALAQDECEKKPTCGGTKTEQYLCFISFYTGCTLKQVNKLPTYLEEVWTMAQSWNDTEEAKKVLPEQQALFAKLDSAFNPEQKELDRSAIANTMSLKYLKAGSANPNNPTPPTNANELSYSVLFGKPVVNDEKFKGNEQKYIQAYLENAANVNYMLKQVEMTQWKKTNPYKARYEGFYNTMTSIQSFNNYVMTGLFKQNDIDSTSSELARKASHPDWFTEVATEHLGLVLRHMLMYTSQIYVQLNRMTVLQQQQLTAQIMTNSLLLMDVQKNVGDDLLRNGNQFK